MQFIGTATSIGLLTDPLRNPFPTTAGMQITQVWGKLNV
jgi:hypothetical protein